MNATPAAQEIPNRFDFAEAAIRLTERWDASGHFHAEPDASRRPYTIVIPPPNVTGALHLGHALNNTLQDVLIRMKRMQGFNTLWMPGTDHAGIATQAVVERRLKEEENLTRHDLGREKLVERIWQWKDQYEARILGQLKQMGCSCDWQRTRFTFDDVCGRAVRHFFFDLFRKESIYRGKRLVNWDTYLQTAVSDDEVFSKTVKGHFWHLQYPVIDPQPGEPDHVIVATTRPETMLGDTAVAVHPDPAKAFDKIAMEIQQKLAESPAADRNGLEQQLEALETRRSQMLAKLEQLRDMAEAGRMIRLPLMERAIPLVCDSWAKPEMGAGCVKITPAHDPNDYEVAKRCDLPMLNIMTPDGLLNAEAGSYEGLNLKEARKRVVADMESAGLLLQVEDREIELPHSDRSKTPIEPLLADQWFVKMDRLAQSAMDAVAEEKVRIFPPRYAKGYTDWLAEKRDWPVSRQLWWGHQIPVWSKACVTRDEAEKLGGEIRGLAGFDETQACIQIEDSDEGDPAKREKLELPAAWVHVCVQQEQDPLEPQLEALGLVREEDVLDTWFSSALWPHSTLGWPDATPELEYFYPTTTLVTSRDIITLWVARMVLAGLNNLGEVPFDRVFIHPKILDGYGETMSKSKGNGIDPLDVIEKFGPDALRFAMVHLTTDTQDVRMPVQFECPHCQTLIEQTRKNRELPAIGCKSCGKEFSTQWAKLDEHQALPRGPVVSERFENARNFGNKLWNAARFALMNLGDYQPRPLSPEHYRLEDCWMLSRLTTVCRQATDALEHFHYGEAARILYDFAWDDFCSFYVEMLKDRLEGEDRWVAQQLMAFSLDTLLRLLHPIMPFITEEIWGMLGELAPQRGLANPQAVVDSVVIAAWPGEQTELSQGLADEQIESQFARFQQSLGALREIRNRQNLGPRDEVEFVIRCDADNASLLEPMQSYFASMARAKLTGIGQDPEIPAINATIAFNEVEIFVNLDGLIDVDAERARIENEIQRLEKAVAAGENKLANENYTSRAPAEVVEQTRQNLANNQALLETMRAALAKLVS